MKQLISQLFQKITIDEKQFVLASFLLHLRGYELSKKEEKRYIKDKDIVEPVEVLISLGGIDVLIKDLMDIKQQIKDNEER